jgi:hypothetical protein
MIDGVLNWLRQIAMVRVKDNRAGEAATLLDELHRANWVLQERGKVMNAKIEQYQKEIVRLRMTLRDVWADLDQSARRSGLTNWMPAELRRGTSEKLTALHGRFGQGRNINV